MLQAWKVADAVEGVPSVDSIHTPHHAPSAGSGYYSLTSETSPTCGDGTPSPPSPPSSLLEFSPYSKTSTSHPATPLSNNNLSHFDNDEDLSVRSSVPEFDSASVSSSTPGRVKGKGMLQLHPNVLTLHDPPGGGGVVTVTAAEKGELSQVCVSSNQGRYLLRARLV